MNERLMIGNSMKSMMGVAESAVDMLRQPFGVIGAASFVDDALLASSFWIPFSISISFVIIILKHFCFYSDGCCWFC